MSNTFGNIFKLTSFGESHGPSIGGIIDGCPAGIELDLDFITQEIRRRQPSQSFFTTKREEFDNVQFLSGVFEGKTTGTPIAFSIKNMDSKSKDYSLIKSIYRPSHADFTYDAKYGFRDYRGGGRSSARETVVRVVAGAIAKLYLNKYDIKITAFVKQIGNLKLEKTYTELDLSTIEASKVRCPDTEKTEQMLELLKDTKMACDSVGGVITCVVKNVPAGLGEPLYNKLTSQLASAMMSINATRGVEFGEGFNASSMKGSEHNDEFHIQDGEIRTRTNRSGGIQGGISNGEDIHFNIAFKPTASIYLDQNTVNQEKEETILKAKGRHDTCFVPRAVPIVEAMTALTLTDFHMLQKSSKI